MNYKNALKKIPLAVSAYHEMRRVQFLRKIKSKIGNHKSVTFIIATPVHGNLGDHAIVYAEHRFLRDTGNRIVIEVSNTEYFLYKEDLKKLIHPNDKIIIDGGGNMGTLWPREDDKIAEIIRSYAHNKIVIFPQTCYYDETTEGHKRLLSNCELYSMHPYLTIAVRDRSSYNFMCENFPAVKTISVPDIVFYIDQLSFSERRAGVLFCFRTDLEKVIADVDIFKIKDYTRAQNLAFRDTSTLVDGEVNAETRAAQLTEKWREFAGASLLITDRLHAMVFCAIVGTPCLALDNKSGKVCGAAEWIKHLPYIKVCVDADDILKNFHRFYRMKPARYQCDKMQFEPLEKVVKYE